MFPALLCGSWRRLLANDVSYIRLLRESPQIVGFGVSLTFISSFGQTFFISLSSDRVLESLGIGHSTWGAFYSAATLASALTLPFVGRALDRVALPRFAAGVLLGLSVACALFASVFWVPMLFFALYCLRLTGQGLMGLMASTTMARSFDESRGTALSLSSLGFSVGELVFPIVVPVLFALLGWRAGWMACALVVGLGAAPIILKLLRLKGRFRFPESVLHPSIQGSGNQSGIPRSRFGGLGPFKDLRFLAAMPAYVTPGCVATGLILYQLALAEEKGWSDRWITGSFAAFALSRFVSSLLVGPMIDRFRAIRVFPLHLAPLGIGVAFMAAGDGAWIAPVYYGLMGVSMGMGGSSGSALWAEKFGVQRLGTIKSSTSMLAIFATAVSPVAIGLGLDRGIGFGTMLPWIVWWIVGATALAFWSCVTKEKREE